MRGQKNKAATQEANATERRAQAEASLLEKGPRASDASLRILQEPETLLYLLSCLGLRDEEVRCVYLRGSRAVGYASPDSDWDFVIVTTFAGTPQEDLHIKDGALGAVLYDEQSFARLVRDCCVWALECIFAPRPCILREAIDFRALFASHRAQTPASILHSKLRRSVFFESGRKWSQAKQKLQEGEQRDARKRIFIALRFLRYGIEVARTGEIAELGCANQLWTRIIEDPGTTWAALQRSFSPLYKELRSALYRESPALPRYGGVRHHAVQRGNAKARVSIPYERSAPTSTTETQLETVTRLRALDPSPEAALAQLQSDFQLQVQRHARHPNIVQLRYSPRSAPRGHPVIRECRGLILDAARGFEVLAYPFARFFNLGEEPTTLDWSTARAFEKLDGSLAILYWYGDAWQVASSRRPDASGLLGVRSPEGGVPFDVLFWEVWRQEGYQSPPPQERRCYLFELTTRRHPIIVRYPEERLTLIGARDLVTLQELDPSVVARERGWRSLTAIFSEVGDALQKKATEAALTLDASLQEGFVVCDAQFQRVKIKSPEYLRMTWKFPLCSRERLSKRHLLRLVISGEAREFLAYCPEYHAEIQRASLRYESLCAHLQEVYQEIQHASTPTEFAALARAHPFSDVLFGMKKQQRTPHEVMLDLPIKKVERWLKH